MSKIGRNKKKCEHYRTSGNLQTNKLMKQERKEKRIARFAARREAGKAYEYKPNPHTKDSVAYYQEVNKRAVKNGDVRLPLQKFASIMRKLENQLTRERADRKVWKERKKKREPEVV